MKKICMILVLMLAFVSLAEAGQRSISANFVWGPGSPGGWGYHMYLSRSSNPTAGYFTVEDPNEGNGFLVIEPTPSATWNEGKPNKDTVWKAKDESGSTTFGPAYFTFNNDFNWGTSWYMNINNFFADTPIRNAAEAEGATEEEIWAYEDALNKTRVAEGFIGHYNKGGEPTLITSVKKVPYGDYMVLCYMHPNRAGDAQAITIEDQTIYYINQHGTDFKESLKSGLISGWLKTADMEGPASDIANICVFRHLSASDMDMLFSHPDGANSGITAFSIIAESAAEDISSAPVPESGDKTQGNLPVSVDTVLEWTAPVNGADSYDVWYGEYGAEDPNFAMELVSEGQTETSFDPEIEFNKTYCWRVDTNIGGETVIGDQWYFDSEGDPLVLTQPGSTAAGIGGSTSFDVEAVLAENYAWYSSEDEVSDTPEDDVLIQSSEDSMVVIEDVQETDAIFYYAVLTNSIPDSAAVVTDVVSLAIGKLELYLPFDGDPNDASGNGWMGTVTGSVSYEAGVVGQAIRTTDGNVAIDGTVILEDETEVDMFNFYPEGLTVSCWIKADRPYVDTGGWQTVIGKNSSNGWAMRDRKYYSGAGPHFRVSPINTAPGGYRTDADNPDFGGDNWHHWVITNDAGSQTVSCYVDGLLVSSNTGLTNSPLDNGPVKVGSQPNDGAAFIGLIDEVKMYSYPLSATEIVEDYVAVTGNTLCFEDILGDVNDDCKVDMDDFLAVVDDWLDSTNPQADTPSEQASRVVSWQFDETEGMVATDSSVNGIDGTLGSGFTTGQWIVDGGRTGAAGDNALYMDGSENTSVIATVADPNALATGNIFQGTSPWTMNLWVKLVNNATMNNIGGFGYNGWLDPSVDSDRYFASWDGGLEFELGQTGLFPGSGFGNEWRMITSTYDGATCRVYFDGVQVSQAAVTLVDTTVNEINLNTARRVLWSGEDATVPMDAYVDDFSIWDEAFTAQQVAGMYSNSFPSCDGAMDADMNGDCIVDLVDFSIVAADWLECNLIPSSLCD